MTLYATSWMLLNISQILPGSAAACKEKVVTVPGWLHEEGGDSLAKSLACYYTSFALVSQAVLDCNFRVFPHLSPPSTVIT